MEQPKYDVRIGALKELHMSFTFTSPSLLAPQTCIPISQTLRPSDHLHISSPGASPSPKPCGKAINKTCSNPPSGPPSATAGPPRSSCLGRRHGTSEVLFLGGGDMIIVVDVLELSLRDPVRPRTSLTPEVNKYPILSSRSHIVLVDHSPALSSCNMYISPLCCRVCLL